MKNTAGPEKNFLDEASDVVTSLILERGYDNTPMSMIARTLGLTKAGVYHHVESKEDLLYLIHRRMIDSLLMPIIQRAEAEPDLETRLRSFVHEYALLMTRDPSARVSINEARRLSPERYEEIRTLWRRVYRLMRDTIAALQAQGVCRRDVDAGYAAFGALGMCNWTLYWFDYSRPQTGPEVACTISSVFLAGIMAGADGEARKDE